MQLQEWQLLQFAIYFLEEECVSEKVWKISEVVRVDQGTALNEQILETGLGEESGLRILFSLCISLQNAR